jgi:microcystin-dependent protein
MGISSALGGTIGAVPVGSVTAFAGSTAPSGWLLCGGQTVSRTLYSGLFLTIGTTYGSGDGSTTFALPDLRGRVPAGLDNMGGTAASRLTSTVLTASNTLGATGGTQTHTLTAAQSGVPAHTHTFAIGNVSTFTGIVGSTGHGGTVRDTGTTDNNSAANASSAHPITQPTIVLNYIIKAS